MIQKMAYYLRRTNKQVNIKNLMNMVLKFSMINMVLFIGMIMIGIGLLYCRMDRLKDMIKKVIKLREIL